MSHGFADQHGYGAGFDSLLLRFVCDQQNCIGPPARKERAPQDDKAGI